MTALLPNIDRDICLHAWFDTDARQVLETLCREIGPRPAGSAGLRQARQYLAGRLATLGATAIREEPVPVRSWEPGEPRVELLEPFTKSYACGQYLFSSSIDTTLQLVNLEDTADLHDKAVVMDGHTVSGRKYVSVRQRLDEVNRRGAAAIITRSTPLTGYPALDIAGMADDFPLACFSVSRDDGAELMEVAARNAQIRLVANGSSAPETCANLAADLGPDQPASEMIILGAHFDSYWNAPGAGDNLTGVVTMLEVARLLAPFRQSFRRSLRLVAFTAEEIGCLGSRAYVDAHQGELDHIALMMNMDTLFPATTRGTAVMWAPELRDYINEVFRKANRQVDVRNLFCCSSDYFPFMLAGLPAIRPADWENSLPIEWHSVLDDLEHIRVDWLQHNAMIYAQLLARLLTEPALPVRRLSQEEVKERLATEELGEWMKAQGYDA